MFKKFYTSCLVFLLVNNPVIVAGVSQVYAADNQAGVVDAQMSVETVDQKYIVKPMSLEQINSAHDKENLKALGVWALCYIGWVLLISEINFARSPHELFSPKTYGMVTGIPCLVGTGIFFRHLYKCGKKYTLLREEAKKLKN